MNTSMQDDKQKALESHLRSFLFLIWAKEKINSMGWLPTIRHYLPI